MAEAFEAVEPVDPAGVVDADGNNFGARDPTNRFCPNFAVFVLPHLERPGLVGPTFEHVEGPTRRRVQSGDVRSGDCLFPSARRRRGHH